jgi:hypothetical protein
MSTQTTDLEQRFTHVETFVERWVFRISLGIPLLLLSVAVPGYLWPPSPASHPELANLVVASVWLLIGYPCFFGLACVPALAVLIGWRLYKWWARRVVASANP